MAVRRVEELFGWRLADRFRLEVIRLVRRSPEATADHRYRRQLLMAAGSAVANVSEGFARCNPGEFGRFLDFAIASLGEAEFWLHDGVDRGYFTKNDCALPLRFKRRAWKVLVLLKRSQVREAARRRGQRRPKAPRKKKRPT